jgi:hypothetical protein
MDELTDRLRRVVASKRAKDKPTALPPDKSQHYADVMRKLTGLSETDFFYNRSEDKYEAIVMDGEKEAIEFDGPMPPSSGERVDPDRLRGVACRIYSELDARGLHPVVRVSMPDELGRKNVLVMYIAP